MSTFHGRIKEYPTLSIDHFITTDTPKHYILSHVHKDHTQGLENINFNQSIYCTEQTALLLPLLENRTTKQLMYKHLKQYLIPIPYHQPMTITADTTIKFTFLPANHCPGAALILVEGKNGTVLYTGDMRAEPDFVKAELDCLQSYRIKNLYMDTTCCYSDKRNFISKTQSINILVNLIKSYPVTHHMYLDCWTVGYEEMWISITENFGQKIHVSQQRYNMFCHANSLFDDILTTDPKTRFHSCHWDQECYIHEEYTISIHPTPNKNTKAFPHSPFRRLLNSDLPWDCEPLQRMILPFSTHSSLSEIVFFHKFIKPSEFTPCVVRGGWKTLDQMRLLLSQEGCTLDTPPSLDVEPVLHDQQGTCQLRSSMDQQSSDQSSINYLSPCNSLCTTTPYTPIILFLPPTQDHVLVTPSIHRQPSLSESEPDNEPFITKENTYKLLKSMKRLQKKRRLGSKNNPIP
ncbi:hypothetical protein INT47_006174, partial [Mucor saturninus]